MKKRIFSTMALLSIVGLMAACSGNGGKIETGDLQEIDEGTFLEASTQAALNQQKVSSVDAYTRDAEDTTKLYTGGLSYLAKSSTVETSGTVYVGSNLAVYQKGDLNSVKTDQQGGQVKSKETLEAKVFLMSDPAAALGANLDLCNYLKDTRDGIVSETNTVANKGIVDLEHASVLFDAFVSNMLYKETDFTATTGTLGYDSNHNVVRYQTTTSTTIETNPLYPSDTTKDVTVIRETINIVKFAMNSNLKSYVLDSTYSYSSVAYVTNFQQEVLDKPIIVAEQIDKYSFKYDTRKEVSDLVYPKEVNALPSIVLTTFDTSYARITTFGITLSDVTSKMVSADATYANFKLVGYIDISSEQAGLYLALSTAKDATLETPLYEKWGFSAVKASSIVAETITDPKVEGHNFFTATEGKYAVTVEINRTDLSLANLELTYLGGKDSI